MTGGMADPKPAGAAALGKSNEAIPQPPRVYTAPCASTYSAYSECELVM
jgi:hypothetical protein